MTLKSRLHIPQPSARPGEAPDFSYLDLSEAGAVARPDHATPASKIENLAHELVRVMDDGGMAQGE
ncbi:MAG: 3-methyl-2-oxobutanoate dehydrogenase (2-methylpropanoyl-transferring) subunit alpha, partial [Gammaproteobacteria bacterium]|nr:3-methyl-2-oxobutanoate dehydrogenase (2-methylpropanoyl-transferring) subunit alpha [Gammaproteobacteria bacterium]